MSDVDENEDDVSKMLVDYHKFYVDNCDYCDIDEYEYAHRHHHHCNHCHHKLIIVIIDVVTFDIPDDEEHMLEVLEPVCRLCIGPAELRLPNNHNCEYEA